jgi:hypothetical protein
MNNSNYRPHNWIIRTGEETYIISNQRGAINISKGWAVVGAIAYARTQETGSPREQGERPGML